MQFTPEQLAEILKAHCKWLWGERDGERANLTDAVLTRANLRGANLTDAVLTCAVLTRADLTDADMRGANLTDADMRGANLTDAVLTRAVLTRADLRGAVLRGANLTDANLTGAAYWDTTGDRRYIKSMQLERYSVVYTHDRLQVGCKQYAIEDWWSLDDDRIASMDPDCALEWWRKWKPVLQQVIELSPAEPTGAEGGAK